MSDVIAKEVASHITQSGKQLVINPTFIPLFSDKLSDPRYYQVYGGRGSGKSFVLSIAMVQLTYSKYKHKILYLRQVMSSQEDSTISDIRAAIDILGLGLDFKEVKGTIVNVRTGNSIIFKGFRTSSGQTAKLKSLSGVTTLVCEEAEEIESFAEFSKVDESIRVLGIPLKVILMYNPTSSLSSWIHDEWFFEGQPKLDRKIENGGDTIYMHSTYLDNLDNLNPSVIKRYESLKVSNPTYYKHTILAEWTLVVDGQIYEGWEEKEGDYKGPGQTWYGLDFGYGGNDSTSMIKITYHDNTYHVKMLFSESKMTLSQLKQKIIANGVEPNVEVYCDSAMPLLKEELRTSVLPQIKNATKGNVEAGIKKIQDKKIVLYGGKETKLYYAYKTFRRNENGKLPHEPDELAAMRYGINSKLISNINSNRSKVLRQRGYV